MATLHADFDEGRIVRNICCLSCRVETIGRLSNATAPKSFTPMLAIDCDNCSEELVKFEAYFDKVVVA